MKAVALIALFVAAANAAVQVTLDADASWTAWKLKYGKTYLSANEDTTRQAIFNKNVAFINKHNARNDVTYTLGMNQFGDLTNAEYQRMYLRPYNGTRTGETFVQGNEVDPTSQDWRTQGYVTPIKDQGQCGSCWSFSSTGSIEGAHFKSTGQLVVFSEQNLVDCSTSEGNQGCNGGLMDYAFTYVIKNKGLDTEASYKYTARDGTCKKVPSVSTISSYKDIPSGNEQALLVAVNTQPIAIAIEADQSCFQFYHQGVLDDASCGTNLDHGVLLAGYDTDAASKKDYWLVKNSWGASWGDKGYIKFVRGKNQCGLTLAASYPVA